MNRQQNRRGLARITSAPPPPEYNVQQFLGDPPPTVPPVLGADLFHAGASAGHVSPVVDRRHPGS